MTGDVVAWDMLTAVAFLTSCDRDDTVDRWTEMYHELDAGQRVRLTGVLVKWLSEMVDAACADLGVDRSEYLREVALAAASETTT